MNELEIVGGGVHLYLSDLQFLGVRLQGVVYAYYCKLTEIIPPCRSLLRHSV